MTTQETEMSDKARILGSEPLRARVGLRPLRLFASSFCSSDHTFDTPFVVNSRLSMVIHVKPVPK